MHETCASSVHRGGGGHGGIGGGSGGDGGDGGLGGDGGCGGGHGGLGGRGQPSSQSQSTHSGMVLQSCAPLHHDAHLRWSSSFVTQNRW